MEQVCKDSHGPLDGVRVLQHTGSPSVYLMLADEDQVNVNWHGVVVMKPEKQAE